MERFRIHIPHVSPSISLCCLVAFGCFAAEVARVLQSSHIFAVGVGVIFVILDLYLILSSLVAFVQSTHSFLLICCKNIQKKIGY